jgi:hypothetical protein
MADCFNSTALAEDGESVNAMLLAGVLRVLVEIHGQLERIEDEQERQGG